MASIHKHSSGRSPYWFAKYTGADGRPIVKSTKQIQRDKAMAVALDWQHNARLAREGRLTKGQAVKVLNQLLEKVGADSIKNDSVETYLRGWLKGKELSKSDGTFLRYSNTVDIFLKSLEKRKFVSITNILPKDIEKFRDDNLGKGKAPSTVNVDLKTLRNAFNTACRRGLLDTNPIDLIEFPKEKRNTKDTFSTKQIQALLKVASDEWKTAILFGYYASMRLGDAVSIQEGEIDFLNKLIRYSPQKTKKTVECPLHEDLERHLLKEPIKSRKPESKLTPTLNSMEIGGRSGLSRAFKDLMEKAGIDDGRIESLEKGGRAFSKLSFHALRHTSVSAMANAGVSAEIRMKISGHTNESAHAGYTHLEFQPLRDGITKLPSVFENN
jgi:integrase